MKDIWITLQDGRRLAARLWLPDVAQHPVPAILEYLPYRKRDATASRDDATYPVFAAAGYAGVRVDTPGNGDSDGYMSDEYTEDELASGEEVISWIAKQPWCSGSVGMIGISWGGFNGLQIAMRRPPALKAIVTVCSTADRYNHDIHYMGGCPLTDNFNWSAQMAAYSARPPDSALREDWHELWLDRLNRLPLLASNWFRHPRRDIYWKHGSVCEDWQAIQCPVLTIGGWADYYSDAPQQLLTNLSAPTKALVGPWEHKYPHLSLIEPRADFHGEVINWFDKWLKGINNGADALPAYRAYMQEHGNPSVCYDAQPGRWISEATWPASSVVPMTLHLASSDSATGGALLTANKNAAAIITISSPQHLGAAAGWLCPGMRIENELPDNQSDDDALSACFDRPLSEALEILGAPQMEIEFSVDKPQAMAVLRLCDVAPNGVSERVSYTPFNLSQRESQERPVVLTPHRRYRAKITMSHCAHRFLAGHVLRLAISTSYWPLVWPSPEAATITLHLENCRLILPARQSDNNNDQAAPAPAREYPSPISEQLHPAAGQLSRATLPDGMHALWAYDDFGKNRDPRHGMQIGSSVSQSYFIHPDKPLSARADTVWTHTYQRGEEWRAHITSTHSMRTTKTAFCLSQTMTVTENGSVIFNKEWAESIPRDSN